MAEILARLEADPVELREQVLAEALLAQIAQPLQEMLRRGLVFELPVPREALAAVCESIPNLDQQINRAVALGLLEVSPDESLRVPHILPLKLPKDAEVLHKQAAEVLVYRTPSWKLAEWSLEEQALEVHRLALRGKAVTIAIKIADALADSWNRCSRYREVIKICNKTLKLERDYRILDSLAWAKYSLGKPEALQHYQEALQNFPINGDESIKAAIISNLANLLIRKGQVKEAFNLLQESLEIVKRLRDLQGQAMALHKIAEIYFQWGQVEEALDLFQQSLELDSSQLQQAVTLQAIAGISAQQGKAEEAIDLLQQSLRLQERIGNVQGQIAAFHAIGRICAEQGQVVKALAFLQQALELEESTGCVKDKAATLHELARIYIRQGQFYKAITLLQQSLEISKRINSAKDEAAALHELAYVYLEQGEPKEAIINLLQQSLTIERRIGNLEGQAATLSVLGQSLAVRGDFDIGLRYLQEAIKIFQHLKSPEAERIRNILPIFQQMEKIWQQSKKSQKRKKKDWIKLNLE